MTDTRPRLGDSFVGCRHVSSEGDAKYGLVYWFELGPEPWLFELDGQWAEARWLLACDWCAPTFLRGLDAAEADCWVETKAIVRFGALGPRIVASMLEVLDARPEYLH